MTKKFTKKKRSLVETVLMIAGGIFLILNGLVISLISFPLMLIIIGFFTLIGGCAIMLVGYVMIATSFYKSVKCPKCSKSVNPRRKDKMICLACKNILKFK